MDDATNPAVTSQLAINPRFLQEVVENPQLLKDLQTRLYVLHMHQMHTRMREHNAPLGAKQTFIEHLAKAADINPRDNGPGSGKAGPGFSVNIVLSSDKGKQTQVVQAVQVVENTPDHTSTPTLGAPSNE